MLLKYLKLRNFRQFMEEQTICFSTEPDQNVTIILGDNGTGKTTLAQAFSWCMYGDVDFADKRILSKSVELQMRPRDEAVVHVELGLRHKELDYVLVRTQRFFADNTGRVKCDPPKFTMQYTTTQGQVEYVKEIALNGRRNEILSRELSRYFFFDGERIGNMSKEIQAGRSKEFGEAVRSLLGLSSIAKALEYLKPTRQTSVIGQYNAALSATSNTKLADKAREIERLQHEIDKRNTELESAEREIENLSVRCDELVEKIATLKESEAMATRLAALRRDLSDKKRALQGAYIDLFSDFNTRAHGFFASPIVAPVAEELANSGSIDRGVPNVTDKTISFLLERKRCICGAPIEVSNDAFRHLTELLNYIPPKSLGTSITEFVNISQQDTKVGRGYFESYKRKMQLIRGLENDLMRISDDIATIEKELEGKEKAGPLQAELNDKRSRKRKLEDRVKLLISEIGGLSSDRDRRQHERDQLAGEDQKNKLISQYMAYAQAIYDDLDSVYRRKEAEIRIELQDTINSIFRRIYNGGISLAINERYAIQVTVSNSIGSDTGVETSTAQSISIIFAFIAGVIQMARNVKRGSQTLEDENSMLSAEPYPLVMDAPLSAFDKRRIKNVCDVLPSIAEQVIIFIKDTDGDMAEEYMGHRVGARYSFVKLNEFESVVNRR